MDEKGIANAIPGGKYGCALLLQFHYPEKFAGVTLGKLVAMVKKSIQDQKFSHYKTLIYQNQCFNKVKVNKGIENRVKRRIVDLVRCVSSNEGISLSQLPILYREKYQERLQF